MGFNISGLWKTLLQMVLPMVKLAGESYRNQDDNDTGKDDLIGYSLEYLADLGTAILTGDTAKIKTQLNKQAPENLS